MKRSLSFVASTLLAATLAVGCGGGSAKTSSGSSGARLSKSDYEQRVSALGAELNTKVSSSGPVSAKQIDPKQLDRDAAALAAYAAGLAKLEPPADAENAHNLLVAGSREYASAMHTAAVDVRAGKLASPDDLTRRLNRLGALQKIQDATTALQAKGYSFDPGG